MELAGRAEIEQALGAVGMQLEIRRQGPFEIVVIGGAAMNVLGLLDRPTRDVDVLAVGEAEDDGGVVFVKSPSLPDALLDAAAAAARDFDLEPGWLNSGPADLLDHGLPPGLLGRMPRYATGRDSSFTFRLVSTSCVSRSTRPPTQGSDATRKTSQPSHRREPSC